CERNIRNVRISAWTCSITAPIGPRRIFEVVGSTRMALLRNALGTSGQRASPWPRKTQVEGDCRHGSARGLRRSTKASGVDGVSWEMAGGADIGRPPPGRKRAGAAIANSGRLDFRRGVRDGGDS